jgi:hypothetical protein
MRPVINTLGILALAAALAVVLLGPGPATAPHKLFAAMDAFPSARAAVPARVSVEAPPVPADTPVFTAADDAADDAAVDAARAAEEGRHATRVLEALRATHLHLDDVTVIIGITPNGEEAIAYYTEGEIVIDREHTVDIDTILQHEIWHIIDWRDNGRLDWGENLPPDNASAYLTN